GGRDGPWRRRCGSAACSSARAAGRVHAEAMERGADGPGGGVEGVGQAVGGQPALLVAGDEVGGVVGSGISVSREGGPRRPTPTAAAGGRASRVFQTRNADATPARGTWCPGRP